MTDRVARSPLQTIVLVAVSGVLVLIVAMGIAGLVIMRWFSNVDTVRIVNDTTQTWAICGDDCSDHHPTLRPGKSTTVKTRNSSAISLEQHGRVVDCVFPRDATSPLLRISARRDCVQ
jgi:hypothetical protein